MASIDLQQYQRDLNDGTVGGRILYHAVSDVRWAGILELERAVGQDRRMSNLFRRDSPVKASIEYTFAKKDVAEIRFKPAGMFTIMTRQGHGNPLAAATAAIPDAIDRATEFVIRSDY